MSSRPDSEMISEEGFIKSSLLFASAEVLQEANSERFVDQVKMSLLDKECNKSVLDPAAILQFYLDGTGSNYDVRHIVRSSIALAFIRSGLVTDASDIFHENGQICSALLERFLPSATGLSFGLADAKDIERSELLPNLAVNPLWAEFPAPYCGVMTRPDKPSVELRSVKGGAYVHPCNTVIYDLERRNVWRETNHHSLNLSVLSAPTLTVTGNIVILQDRFSGSSIAHFLFDYITRLLYFVRYAKLGGAKDLFIMGGIPGAYHRLVLGLAAELLGLNFKQIVFPSKGFNIQPAGKIYWLSDSVANHHPAQLARRESLDFLLEIGARIIRSISVSEKIYISRGDAKARRLANEAELMEQLEPQGFKLVRLSEHSAREQVSIVRSATHIIAPHGMGLTHLALHPGRPMVIELLNPSIGSDAYAAIAVSNGHRYAAIVGKESDASTKDFIVEIEDVMVALNNAG